MTMTKDDSLPALPNLYNTNHLNLPPSRLPVDYLTKTLLGTPGSSICPFDMLKNNKSYDDLNVPIRLGI